MISVIIPLYNKEDTIVRAVESVLDQSYRDFEIIVVDDGSVDKGPELVKALSDPRIHLISQFNGGVSKARNTGIENAKGKYVAFLDADDVWSSSHLHDISYLISTYPQCHAYATSYQMNQRGKVSDIILNKIPFAGETGVLSNYFEVASCSHPPVWSSAACVEKLLLEGIGGFPVGVTSGEDLLTWAMIAVETDWAYSLKPSAFFMLGEGAVSKPRRKHDKEDVVGNALKELYLQNSSTKGLSNYVSMWFKMRAMCCLQTNDRFGVLRESLRSLRYDIGNMKVYAFCIMALLPSPVIRKLIERFTR